MSTAGQFSSKNPTVKRILREAAELANQPSSDYHAAPLESDLFEWHFTLRGPPAPSPYEGGIYHGRIVLPPAYPLKPPSFRFLTPTGRFEVNREICLSISGHHEETWQPAWGIRTALVAIRSFMDTDAKGQLGGMDASEEVRRRLAGQSPTSRCSTCAKSNEDIMREHDAAVQENGDASAIHKEEVPEQLRLAYREDLNVTKDKPVAPEPEPAKAPIILSNALAASTATSTVPETPAQRAPVPTRTVPPSAPALAPAMTREQLRARRRQLDEELPGWLNPAIYAVMAALVYILWRRFM